MPSILLKPISWNDSCDKYAFSYVYYCLLIILVSHKICYCCDKTEDKTNLLWHRFTQRESCKGWLDVCHLKRSLHLTCICMCQMFVCFQILVVILLVVVLCYSFYGASCAKLFMTQNKDYQRHPHFYCIYACMKRFTSWFRSLKIKSFILPLSCLNSVSKILMW